MAAPTDNRKPLDDIKRDDSLFEVFVSHEDNQHHSENPTTSTDTSTRQTTINQQHQRTNSGGGATGNPNLLRATTPFTPSSAPGQQQQQQLQIRFLPSPRLTSDIDPNQMKSITTITGNTNNNNPLFTLPVSATGAIISSITRQQKQQQLALFDHSLNPTQSNSPAVQSLMQQQQNQNSNSKRNSYGFAYHTTNYSPLSSVPPPQQHSVAISLSKLVTDLAGPEYHSQMMQQQHSPVSSTTPSPKNAAASAAGTSVTNSNINNSPPSTTHNSHHHHHHVHQQRRTATKIFLKHLQKKAAAALAVLTNNNNSNSEGQHQENNNSIMETNPFLAGGDNSVFKTQQRISNIVVASSSAGGATTTRRKMSDDSARTSSSSTTANQDRHAKSTPLSGAALEEFEKQFRSKDHENATTRIEDAPSPLNATANASTGTHAFHSSFVANNGNNNSNKNQVIMNASTTSNNGGSHSPLRKDESNVTALPFGSNNVSPKNSMRQQHDEGQSTNVAVAVSSNSSSALLTEWQQKQQVSNNGNDRNSLEKDEGRRSPSPATSFQHHLRNINNRIPQENNYNNSDDLQTPQSGGGMNDSTTTSQQMNASSSQGISNTSFGAAANLSTSSHQRVMTMNQCDDETKSVSPTQQQQQQQQPRKRSVIVTEEEDDNTKHQQNTTTHSPPSLSKPPLPQSPLSHSNKECTPESATGKTLSTNNTSQSQSSSQKAKTQQFPTQPPSENQEKQQQRSVSSRKVSVFSNSSQQTSSQQQNLSSSSFGNLMTMMNNSTNANNGAIPMIPLPVVEDFIEKLLALIYPTSPGIPTTATNAATFQHAGLKKESSTSPTNSMSPDHQHHQNNSNNATSNNLSAFYYGHTNSGGSATNSANANHYLNPSGPPSLHISRRESVAGSVANYNVNIVSQQQSSNNVLKQTTTGGDGLISFIPDGSDQDGASDVGSLANTLTLQQQQQHHQQHQQQQHQSTAPAPAPAPTFTTAAALTTQSSQPTFSFQHTTKIYEDMIVEGMRQINQYQFIMSIGEGCQGTCWLCVDTKSGECRAVKEVSRPVPNLSSVRSKVETRRQRRRLLQEISVMKRCRHPNLVTLYEVIDDPDEPSVFLVMKFIEHGPLLRLEGEAVASKTFSVRQIVRYATQLCSALEYLHERKIVHCDIKPENVLEGVDEQVFLADFGVSRLFPADEEQQQKFAALSRRGSMRMFPPNSLSNAVSRRGSTKDLTSLLSAPARKPGLGGLGAAGVSEMDLEGRGFAEGHHFESMKVIDRFVGTTAFHPPEKFGGIHQHTHKDDHSGEAASNPAASSQGSPQTPSFGSNPNFTAVVPPTGSSPPPSSQIQPLGDNNKQLASPPRKTVNPKDLEKLKQADIWALGCSIYCMLYGKMIYNESLCAMTEFMEYLTSPEPVPTPAFAAYDGEEIEHGVLDALKLMIEKEPSKRGTASDCHAAWRKLNAELEARAIESDFAGNESLSSNPFGDSVTDVNVLSGALSEGNNGDDDDEEENNNKSRITADNILTAAAGNNDSDNNNADGCYSQARKDSTFTGFSNNHYSSTNSNLLIPDGSGVTTRRPSSNNPTVTTTTSGNYRQTSSPPNHNNQSAVASSPMSSSSNNNNNNSDGDDDQNNGNNSSSQDSSFIYNRTRRATAKRVSSFTRIDNGNSNYNSSNNNEDDVAPSSLEATATELPKEDQQAARPVLTIITGEEVEQEEEGVTNASMATMNLSVSAITVNTGSTGILHNQPQQNVPPPPPAPLATSMSSSDNNNNDHNNSSGTGSPLLAGTTNGSSSPPASFQSSARHRHLQQQ